MTRSLTIAVACLATTDSLGGAAIAADTNHEHSL
jgi:hypothetical protein